MPIILASGSPRRRQLLARLGLPFRIVVPDVDEDVSSNADLTPEEMAEALARAKALSVAQRDRGGLVLAADTLVVEDDTILGKPRDADEAAAMLRRLRDREHRVITGIALLNPAQPGSVGIPPPPEGGGIHAAPFTARCQKSPFGTLGLVDHVTTAVRMRPYSEEEIAAYIARGEPFDKAGAYAIQDPAFHPVASYDGCYCNVVGLPLRAVIRLLRRVGLDITHEHLAGLPSECERCRAEV
ncbi:MAG TPA: Maf family protein [Dehalococcoidia bacterium]|nr:Maf family protein [Dehalococcoidia bacterium]